MLTNDPVPFMTAKVTEHAANKVAFLCSSEREALHDVSVTSLQDIVWKCWKINNAELLAKLLELSAAGDGATCWVCSTFAFLCNPALHISSSLGVHTCLPPLLRFHGRTKHCWVRPCKYMWAQSGMN